MFACDNSRYRLRAKTFISINWFIKITKGQKDTKYARGAEVAELAAAQVVADKHVARRHVAVHYVVLL